MRRLTTTVDRHDARSNGSWRFVQKDADGNAYAFHGVFHEVKAPERVIATFEFEGVPGHVAFETMTLEEVGGRTLLTTRSVSQSVMDRDMVVQSGMESGASESMDCRAEFLAKA